MIAAYAATVVGSFLGVHRLATANVMMLAAKPRPRSIRRGCAVET
jgi:hypothetical protein